MYATLENAAGTVVGEVDHRSWCWSLSSFC